MKYAAPPLEATWDGTLKTNGGETFTFKVKAENAAGELVEFSHGFVMTAA